VWLAIRSSTEDQPLFRLCLIPLDELSQHGACEGSYIAAQPIQCEIVDVGRTVVSPVRMIRETDQRYSRTRSRYGFVPASPTCLGDVDTREQERQVRAAHFHGPMWTIPDIKRGRLTGRGLIGMNPKSETAS
jgi:hypothetical protein